MNSLREVIVLYMKSPSNYNTCYALLDKIIIAPNVDYKIKTACYGWMGKILQNTYNSNSHKVWRRGAMLGDNYCRAQYFRRRRVVSKYIKYLKKSVDEGHPLGIAEYSLY